jgi:hypothetical protein
MNITKMTVREIIANFERPTGDKPHEYYDADWDDLCNMANRGYNFYDYTKFAASVKEYFVASWICTDTRVGFSLICLNDEVVALSWQNARKSGKHVEYISKEAYDKLEDFLMTCLDKDDQYTICDMDDDVQIPTGPGIEYRYVKGLQSDDKSV